MTHTLKRIILAGLVALCLTTPVSATQNFLSIDPSVPSGDTGTTMANKLNDWKASILSLLSGSSRPSVAASGTLWLDTTSSTWAVKLYNGSSDTTLFTVDSTNLRPIFAGAIPWISAGGTADAITGTFSPVIGALTDGMLVGVKAGSANTSTTPTFQANSTTAKTIVKHNGAALLAGDIVGSGHEILLRYNLGLDKWVLLNPGAVNIPNDSITSAKIVDGAVSSADISDGTVTGTDISNSTITNADIASNTILGSNITDATVDVADLASAVTSKFTPIGTMIQWTGGSCPSQYLEANGSAISRTTYSVLFGITSTRFGSGDTTTTFNLPDMRGKFARGWDHGAGNDTDAASRTAQTTGGATGDNVGSVQADAFKTHTHTYDDHGSGTNTFDASGGSSGATPNNSVRTSDPTGGTETRPKNINILYCVFTGV